MFLTIEGADTGKMKWHRLKREGLKKKKKQDRAGAMWLVFASVVSDSQSQQRLVLEAVHKAGLSVGSLLYAHVQLLK